MIRIYKKNVNSVLALLTQKKIGFTILFKRQTEGKRFAGLKGRYWYERKIYRVYGWQIRNR